MFRNTNTYHTYIHICRYIHTRACVHLGILMHNKHQKYIVIITVQTCIELIH